MSQSKQHCFPTQEELKKIFNDKSGGDGQLSASELWNWMGVQGYDVDLIMTDLDKDKSGSISEDEFLFEVMKTPRQQALEEYFDAMDKDKLGKLSYADIEEKLSGIELGAEMLQKFDKEKIVSEFSKMDPDGDGAITKEEFVRYMNKRY